MNQPARSRMVISLTSVALVLSSAFVLNAQASPVALDRFAIAPSVIGSAGCDASGDEHPTDDCARASVTNLDKKSAILGGKPYISHLTVHRSLRGKNLFATVQYRTVSASGKRGAWLNETSYFWPARQSLTSPVKDFEVCAPVRPGKYESRTVLRVQPDVKRPIIGQARSRFTAEVPSASLKPSASSSALVPSAPLPSPSITPSGTPTSGSTGRPAATVAPSPTASPTRSASVAPVPAVPQQTAVVTTATTSVVATFNINRCSDLQNENYSMITAYNKFISDPQTVDMLELGVSSDGTNYYFRLMCSPSFVPSMSFGASLRLFTDDAISSVLCNGGAISLPVATASTLRTCDPTGRTCTFNVILLNSSVGAILGSTQVLVNVVDQHYPEEDQPVVIPLQLNTAALPKCTPPWVV